MDIDNDSDSGTENGSPHLTIGDGYKSKVSQTEIIILD